jgi:hypothetical protein
LDTATASNSAGSNVTASVGTASNLLSGGFYDGYTDSATAPTFGVYNRTVPNYTGARFWAQLDSVTAPMYGTYNYTAIVTVYSVPSVGSTVTATEYSKDFSITVATPSTLSTTVAPASSKAFMNAGTSTAIGTQDAVVTAVATASSTVAATIPVRTYNAAGGAAAESVTATLTGTAGSLCVGAICGTSLVLTGATGETDITVLPNGVAGVATINIKTTTVTFAPKTVTFYAKAAKTITASVAHPTLAVGANTGAVAVTAVDANGTNWTGQAYIVASSAADALVAGSTTPVACAAYNSTDGILCPVTAIAAGTAKLKVIDASTVALATATSNEVTVTSSSATANTVKLAFDKSTYAPFEKATITVTPVDVAGKNIAAQTLANLFATGGITSTIGFSANSDTLTAVSITTDAKTGAASYTVYMPAASGDVTISATGGTSLPAAGQVKVSATASVVNSSVDAATDAANEATDAANAATDAALAAADAADAATAAAQDASDAVAALSASVSKLISSLRAQITSLTNLVIKIQKKVRA